MARDRGEYRSIARVLIDGPDFQRLSPEAKLVFLVTKIAIGPSGIDVVPALVATTVERSGLPVARVEEAIGELVASQWLAIEGNVVWVVGGLRYEPGLTATNQKHRTGLSRHVAGLPRIALVARFVAEHPEWFDDAAALVAGYPPVDSIPNGYPIEGLSNYLRPNTYNLRPKTDMSDSVATEPDLFEEAWAAYPRRANNPKGKAKRAWTARLKSGVRPETLLAGVRAYAAYCERERVEPKFIKLAATFFGPDEHWAADYGPPPERTIPPYLENGDANPEFLAMMRRAVA